MIVIILSIFSFCIRSLPKPLPAPCNLVKRFFTLKSGCMLCPASSGSQTKTVFFLAISCFISLFAQSQSRVRGLVTDAGDQPLAGANVLLLHAHDSSLAKGSMTSREGRYAFEKIGA